MTEISSECKGCVEMIYWLCLGSVLKRQNEICRDGRRRESSLWVIINESFKFTLGRFRQSVLSIFSWGVGRGKEEVGVEGLGGRGSTAKGRFGMGGMDGWMGSDRVADRLDHRQSFSGTLPQSTETKKERGSREERKKPCLQWRDLAGLPLLCLSGSGLQRQRKSRNVQAWWWWCWMGTISVSAPKRRERKSTLRRQKTQLLKGLWKPKSKQAIFSFWAIFRIGDIGHDWVFGDKVKQNPISRPVILKSAK